MAQGKSSSVQRVKVLVKAFEVLEALHAGNRDGVRLSKVSEAVKLPRPTVFRILRTLESMGYIVFDGALESYRIAQRLTDLGQPNTNIVFTRLARPAMMRLLAEFEQTVNLATLENNRIVQKDLIEGLRSVRMQVIPGIVISASRTALGKSILSHLPPEQIEGLLWEPRGGRWRAESKSGMEKLQRDLEEIRRLGYAIDDEEFEKGLRCVGAPVFDKSGSPIGAISVSGSTSSLTDVMLPRIGRRVRTECDAISFTLGYSPEVSSGSRAAGKVVSLP
jgi:IclR family acetate operon transcriptional repressor